jgi:hypothetical protein
MQGNTVTSSTRTLAVTIAAWALGWFLVTHLADASALAETIVIRGGTVFNSRTGKMESDRTVAVEGPRIAFVGDAADYAVSNDARVINAEGKFIIPGLIDAHMHLHFLSTAAGVPDTDLLPKYLAAGVTSVRVAGDHIDAQVAIDKFAMSHAASCPRIFMCSDMSDRDPPIHGDEVGIGVKSPDEIPAIIQRMAECGVITVKIYAGSERAVGKAAIRESHKRGLFVTGHLANYPAQDAVADGIDGLEHITSVFDFVLGGAGRDAVDLNNPVAKALIDDLAAKKVMVAPTLVVFKNMLLEGDQPAIINDLDNATVPPRMREYWAKQVRDQHITDVSLDYRRRVFRKYQELTGALHRAGVKLLAGTDAPEAYCPPGLSLHQELQLLVESGLTEAAALQAATINNAVALRQQENLGSIDKGKLADLVILNTDPTADIGNTRKIAYVIKDGKVVAPVLGASSELPPASR